MGGRPRECNGGGLAAARRHRRRHPGPPRPAAAWRWRAAASTSSPRRATAPRRSRSPGTHVPDVILLDLAMPVMDGLEALPTLRELCPDAKIVVLSGFGAAQMTRRAMAAGADGYLQKGVPLRTILDYVRDVTTDDVPHAPRALTVVPDEPPQRVEQHRRPRHPPRRPCWRRSGSCELADEPMYRVVSANDARQRAARAPLPARDTAVRHRPRPGQPRGRARRRTARTRFEVEQLDQPADGAVLRRSGESLFLYLDEVDDAQDALRRRVADHRPRAARPRPRSSPGWSRPSRARRGYGRRRAQPAARRDRAPGRGCSTASPATC